ncbi:putative gamma-tubulin complex component protein [Helianthus annuus]|nr:putative gamma-tubulin complex component protein [Helianthus annuus]KAJ0644814.1 putative gamma-tubulin complex component protein [Helianthus annuus]KAJ0835869.1 putative gamma-tubulin complex component protein [Helianthus annuus]
MNFLLRVKRAKFVLDKARRWMWKVYHSSWNELCEGMAAAGSLDEVIQVHEAYLLSIHQQCFVVPDKLVSNIFLSIAGYNDRC